MAQAWWKRWLEQIKQHFDPNGPAQDEPPTRQAEPPEQQTLEILALHAGGEPLGPPDEQGFDTTEDYLDPNFFVEQPYPDGQPADTERQVLKQPGWFERAIYSIGATVIILGTLAAIIGGTPVLLAPSRGTKIWLEIICAITSFFIGLRIVRGSVLQAKAETVAQLKERLRRIEDPNAILPEDEREIPERILNQLAPGELLLWQSRPHPLCLIPEIGIYYKRHPWMCAISGIMAICFSGYMLFYSAPVWWVPLVLWPIGYMAAIVADWGRRTYIITTEKFVIVDEIVGTDSRRMTRSQITDDAVKIPGWSVILTWLRITRLAIGIFILETAGQAQQIYKIVFVPQAAQLAAAFGLRSSK